MYRSSKRRGAGRRALCTALVAVAAALSLAPCCAQAQGADAYPNKPIKLIVGFPPGGPVDVMARALAQALTEALNQTVVVDNRAGAGGIIGTEVVARAAPDGYTLLMGTTTLSIQETLYNNLPYSALKDFTAIAEVAAGPQVLVVHNGVPAKNLAELIALAKAQPGKLDYASPSSGGANHLAGEMLKTMAGIDVQHVPYKGGAPAEADLIGGRVTFMFASLPAAVARVKAGQLRAIAVTSPQRNAAAPDIPTMAESGLPGFEVVSWYGLIGPAGLPAPVVAKLNAAVNRVLGSPALKERMVTLGVDGTPGTPEDFAAFIRRDTAKWAKVIRESGAKPD